MSDNSRISWTESTWNFLSGCTKISDGCLHCFIERTPPFRMHGRKFDQPGIGGKTDIILHEDKLDLPLRWRKPRRIFVNSLADLFHDDVPDGYIARAWDVMGRSPQHTFQILTKRPARMRSWLKRWADLDGEQTDGFKVVHGPEATRAAHPSGRGQLFAAMLDSMGTPPDGCAYPTFDWMEGQRWWPAVLPNVHIGVSAESQQWADIRVPLLLDTPAAVRWLSLEPLLGPVDLGIGDPHRGHRSDDVWGHPHPRMCLTCSTDENEVDYFRREPGGGGIDWCVIGGESGPGARRMDLAWASSLVEQCQQAEVPAFVKQLGSPWGRDHHDIETFPGNLQVREYPRPDQLIGATP